MNAELPTEKPNQLDEALRTRRVLEGTLIGTAIGDSLGLPVEGLSRRRQTRLFQGPVRQRLFGPFGLLSDDTEHTIMVAQSLLESPTDVATFQRRLARRFRWWLVGLPAGVGFATLRAILKLWIGFPPGKSAVFSAGNGPAMRCALLGAYFRNVPVRRREFVRASNLITHRDPRAETAAQAVAETAACMPTDHLSVGKLLDSLSSLSPDPEWQNLVSRIRDAHASDHSVGTFAKDIGAENGVTGYAYQTVPVAIYGALRHCDDFRMAITEVIKCGGDTDTVGSITGALVGSRVGPGGIPSEWLDRMIDWPQSISFLKTIAEKLVNQIGSDSPQGAARCMWPAIPMRNLLFLAIVLTHGIRRAFPPY